MAVETKYSEVLEVLCLGVVIAIRKRSGSVEAFTPSREEVCDYNIEGRRYASEASNQIPASN